MIWCGVSFDHYVKRLNTLHSVPRHHFSIGKWRSYLNACTTIALCRCALQQVHFKSEYQFSDFLWQYCMYKFSRSEKPHTKKKSDVPNHGSLLIQYQIPDVGTNLRMISLWYCQFTNSIISWYSRLQRVIETTKGIETIAVGSAVFAFQYTDGLNFSSSLARNLRIYRWFYLLSSFAAHSTQHQRQINKFLFLPRDFLKIKKHVFCSVWMVMHQKISATLFCYSYTNRSSHQKTFAAVAMSLPVNDIISGPLHQCKCLNESRNRIRLCTLLIVIDLFVVYKQTSMKSYQTRQLHWTVVYLSLFYHINERNDRFIERDKMWIMLEKCGISVFLCFWDVEYPLSEILIH